MASLTIRQLDENVKRQLRLRAAAHGRSMEEEARAILGEAVSGKAPPRRNIGAEIHAIFAAIGGVELDLPERELVPDTSIFDLSQERG